MAAATTNGNNDQVPLSVLIVEPDHAVANLLRLVLEEEGCQVQIAATAHAALVNAIADPPHLAVLDTDAPGLPRPTLVTALRMTAGAQLPVLGLTTNHDGADGTDADCFAILDMPFEMDDLVTALREGLKQGRDLAAAKSTLPPVRNRRRPA